MPRLIQYLFIALFISVMSSGCFEGPTGPQCPQGIQGEKGEKGDTVVQEPQDDETVSIALQSINDNIFASPELRYIYYLVTDGKGNPLSSKRVDFEIIEGDATLSANTDLTSNLGKVYVTMNKGTSSTTKVKATVFGYNASVTTTINFE